MSRRARPRRWIAVSTTSIPDPRIRRQQGNHVRCVVVTQLLDEDGVHWQRFGDEQPERLGRPPPTPNDDGAKYSVEKIQTRRSPRNK